MIYDRRKDLIISGGENIYPYQIESVAKYFPEIFS
jgi:O-succinylbenzoic acid--CoA ligase